MQDALNHGNHSGNDASLPLQYDETWALIAPILDDAIAALGEKDRHAVVLRFFQDKSMSEIGDALGASEDAVKKRVSRAMKKLRHYFAKRGISSTAAILAETISTHSIQIAPMGFAKAISAVALTKGSIATASILSLMQTTLKIMAYTKTKIAIAAVLAALLVGGVPTAIIVWYVVNKTNNQSTAVEIAQQSRAAYDALDSYGATINMETEIGSQKNKKTTHFRVQRPHFYWIELAEPQATSFRRIIFGNDSGEYMIVGAVNTINVAKPQKINDRQKGSSDNDFSSVYDIYDRLNQLNMEPRAFDLFTLPFKPQKLPDEKVGGVNCYVIASTNNASDKDGVKTEQLWIGKKDHLVHKRKHTEILNRNWMTSGDQLTDEGIKNMLMSMGKPATPKAIATFRAVVKKDFNIINDAQGKPLVYTLTYENIEVNKKFSPSDFER